MGAKRHIDDVQPSTVDEHLKLIAEDESTIDPDFAKVSPDDLPEWFDEKLFKVGQAHYMDSSVGFGTAFLAGLVAITSVPSIAKILTFSKQTSSQCLGFKRMAQTILHTHELFVSDILDANSKWYKTINTIRWKHAGSSKRCVKQDQQGILQKDMALTQCGFVGYAFTSPKDVGLGHSTPEQLEGSNHFWRVVGSLLGIPDSLNVCRKSAAETTELCSRILREIIAKHMENPIPEFKQLANTMLDGTWYVDVTVDREAHLELTYRLTGLQYKKPLGWYSYLNLKHREGLLYMQSVPYIGKVVRTIYNYITAVLFWSAKNFPVFAWMSFGKKTPQVVLYPRIQ